MNKKYLGMGPKLAFFNLPILILFGILDFFLYPISHFPFNPIYLYIIGIILISYGIIMYFSSVPRFVKAIKNSELITTGIYSHVRHPLYSGIILGIISGIICFFNSWILLIFPACSYILFRILIKEEEKDLIKEFGEKYISYMNETNAMFPKFKKYRT